MPYSIFTNPTISKKVKYVHTSIAEHKISHLLDSLAIPMGWDADKSMRLDLIPVIELLETYTKDNGKDKKFNQFGPYTLIDCAYMWRRAELVCDIQKDYDLRKDLTFKKLEKISLNPLCVTYPSVAAGIKFLLLQEGYSHELERYYGIQPATAPVRRACLKLFGQNFNGDQYGHTLLCNKIAYQIDRSPTYVNTVLWILGGGMDI